MNLYPKSKWINQLRASVFARREWTYGWDPKAWRIEPGISANLARQSFVNVWTTLFNERFAGLEFDGLRRSGFVIESRPVGPALLGMFASHGDAIFRDRTNPFLGTGTDAAADLHEVPVFVALVGNTN